MQRPRITEINVRMDCNGCVQKIKKALTGIHGIYDLYIDFPQQKLTIIGTADPERIMKAIKKVRKVATICSHTEVPDPNCQPTEPLPNNGGAAPPPDGGAPPPGGGDPVQESGNPQPEQPPQPEVAPPPPQEPPRDQPPPPQQPEHPPPPCPQPEHNPPPAPAPADMQPNPPPYPSNPNHGEEGRVIYHNPHDYGRRYGYGNSYGPGYDQSYGAQRSSHPGPSYRQDSDYYERPRPVYHDSPHEYGYHDRHRPVPVYHYPPYHDPQPHQVYHEGPPRENYHEPPPPRSYYQEPPPQPVYATHSYNMYRPAPSLTEYHYVHSPPRYTPSPHSRSDYYDMDSYQYGNTSNGNVSSIFSDENPNACTIV